NMETQTLSHVSILTPVIEQFRLHTRLFNNVLEGVSNLDGPKRFSQRTNPVTWIVGHIVSSRFMAANMIGITDKEPFPQFFANGKGHQNDLNYPNIEELRNAWEPISEKFINKLNELSEEELNAPSPAEFPIGDQTVRGALAFFSDHEAYM